MKPAEEKVRATRKTEAPGDEIAVPAIEETGTPGDEVLGEGDDTVPKPEDVSESADEVEDKDEVPESEDDEGEGEVLNFASVHLGKYKARQVKVKTASIVVPRLAVRKVAKKLVKEMKKEMRRKGYLSSAGMLSVALKKDESWNDKKMEEVREEGRTCLELSENVWLVDGRHRLTAMTELMGEGGKLKTDLESIYVTLWTPPKGDFLMPSEIISLGCQLNHSSGTVRSQTFEDNVHAAHSFAAALRESPDIMGSNREVTSVTLARALHDSGILVTFNKRQRQRYAIVACRLSRSKESFEMFMKLCK